MTVTYLQVQYTAIASRDKKEARKVYIQSSGIN